MPYQSQTLETSKQGWCSKENFGAISICALSMIVIGILMMVGGGTLSFVYYTEITPPNYDAYYQRYVGSSLPRILGPLILVAGLTLFWGSSIFLVWAYYQSKKGSPNKFLYNSRLHMASTNFEETKGKDYYNDQTDVS